MSHSYRTFIALAVCLLCRGQQTPTFRSSTTLVEFTVVATDGAGKPVTDLKREEVSLTENGQARDVATLRFEGVTEGTAPAPLPAGVFSNRPEHDANAPRNIVVIVIDTINTPMQDQLSMRDQMMRYLEELPAGTRVGLYRMSEELVVLHDFTDDIAGLRAKVEKNGIKFQAQTITNWPIRLEKLYNEGVRQRRVAQTLTNLEALGNHLAGTPGPKTLIWLGNGMPIMQNATTARDGGITSLMNYEPFIRRTAQQLASQRIAIYPVDAKGLSRAFLPQNNRITPENSQGVNLATMDVMAEVTGGRVVKFTNDPMKAMRTAAADRRGAYSLGFYSVDEPDNKWHGLKVRVNRPGVKLLHRQGYVSQAPAERSADWPVEEWRSAAQNPLGSKAIRFEARSRIESKTLRVILHIVTEDLSLRKIENQRGTELDLGIAEKSSTGPSRIRHDTGMIPVPDNQQIVEFQHAWQIDPAASTIRLIVRDRFTGRYGTVDLPVKQIPVKTL